uniref:DUF4806 domain-containing protein n=1 Tax=Anopheles stephensi TaxID=30069 RepID=A0A182Y4G5_ANOST
MPFLLLFYPTSESEKAIAKALKSESPSFLLHTPHKPPATHTPTGEGIVGFCFPLSCQEDIDRLESSIRADPAVRAQYIRYLASKKLPNEPVSACFRLLFSHWSLYNFSLHTTDHAKACMKDYKIFTECMMEAWHGLREVELLKELAIALAAAYENSNQSLNYKRRKRSELIQTMLRQKQAR